MDVSYFIYNGERITIINLGHVTSIYEKLMFRVIHGYITPLNSFEASNDPKF